MTDGYHLYAINLATGSTQDITPSFNQTNLLNGAAAIGAGRDDINVFGTYRTQDVLPNGCGLYRQFLFRYNPETELVQNYGYLPTELRRSDGSVVQDVEFGYLCVTRDAKVFYGNFSSREPGKWGVYKITL